MWACVLCTGTYVLKSPEGKPCIKATMGVEYIITDQKVRRSECGTCVPQTGVSAPVWMTCVSISVCVGEVSRASVTTPNCQGKRCQLFFRADCSCEVWCDKKTISFLLRFRRGTLAWTAAGSGSAVAVATRRLFYPSQCLTTQSVCSSPSQR